MTHVYVDYKPDGTPFYIGIGSTRRVRNTERNTFHRNICVKYPKWHREVVETSSMSVCLELEAFLIQEIGRRNLKTGPLVNLTDGGEGCLGMVQSEHCRQVQSNLRKGVRLSEGHKQKIAQAGIGRKHSEEFKQRMQGNTFAKGYVRSEAHSEAVRQALVGNKHTLGLKHTPETKAKISKANKGKPGPNLGKTWVQRGDESRQISQTLLPQHLADGWVLGRSSNPVRPWMFKDDRESRVRSHLVESYLSKGWKMGRKS